MSEGMTEKLGREPRYPLADVARMIEVPVPTLRSWLAGTAKTEPVLRADAELSDGVSFFNFVEASFLATYRRHFKISMQRLRVALEFAAEQLKDPRPLLHERFETDGVDLVARQDDQLVDASGTPGQYEWPEVVEQYFKSIDYDSVGATAFWILGRERSCVVDPRVEFGRPVLPRSGVAIELVNSRFLAGESLDEIAHDFGLGPEEVEEAIRCSTELHIAA